MASRPSCCTTATAATSIRTDRRSTRGKTDECSGDGGTAADRRAAPAARRVVGAAGDDGDRARQLRRVFHVGGIPECVLLGAAVPVAVLLAVPVGEVPARDVRLGIARDLAADHRRAVTRVLDPLGPRPLPSDLLLLPQGLLPFVLAVAAGVRAARCAKAPLHG